jgi:hypothetical protein
VGSNGVGLFALNGVVAGLGGVVGLIWLVFVLWCAVVTIRKRQILLFILGFFCGFAWIYGFVFANDKRHPPEGLGLGHYVPPTPGT